VQFDGALIQWNSALIDAGHTRIQFPRGFAFELTDIIAGGINSESSYPFMTLDSDLDGFWTYCEAPRVISYFAFGR
jgi:hypothetical protein